MKVFNTMSRSMEELIPHRDNEINVYTCGPTVYSRIHIGNFKTFLFEDILVRYLRYLGYKVNHVMNITDVDDKTIRSSRERSIHLDEVTNPFIDMFYKDTRSLHMAPADRFTRATRHIDSMVSLVKKLLENGFAYKTPDGNIYYSISKFKDYGKLAHLDPSNLMSGAGGRTTSDEYEKDSISDFALWKAWDESDGDVYWETSLGKGRPGWHIECSAMSMKYLGETLDIHTGGVDNIFPHHQNEIAQSEGATGKPFCRYWMHSRHLMVDGAKMSKSLGNFYTLDDLKNLEISPEMFRFFVVTNHYRTQLNFTKEAVFASSKGRDSLLEFNRRLSEYEENGSDGDIDKPIKKMLDGFQEAMNDDLNTPKAIAFVFDFSRAVNRLMDERAINKSDAQKVISAINKVNSVFAFLEGEETGIPDHIQQLADERQKAREEKNWKRSDELRDKISELGFLVKDTPKGQRITRR
jgi:cysteinyl-tRNA synthetase